MDQPELRALHLSLLWTVPPRHLRNVEEWVESGRLRFPWTEGDLEPFRDRIPEGVRRSLSQAPTPEAAGRARETMLRLGIRLLDRKHPGFPEELKGIPDPPPFLFLRGSPLREEKRLRVAVIGSRAASPAGREIAYTLGRDLALSGCVVVSGMARGIDGEAHRGALDAGGRTVAVLGTGADVCYPPEHGSLYEAILGRGGAVTEFPPGAAGLRLHFPRRNRILAGLSAAVVVVEGGERSGARSTVDHALDQGAEVMAVPRDILHPGSALPNALLRDGARPVLSSRDVLEGMFGPGTAPPAFVADPCTGAVGSGGGREMQAQPDGRLESKLLTMMSGRTQRVDELARRLPGVSAGELQAALLRLEIMGWAERRVGGIYAAIRG